MFGLFFECFWICSVDNILYQYVKYKMNIQTQPIIFYNSKKISLETKEERHGMNVLTTDDPKRVLDS
jgi:ribonuclease HIII